MTNHVNIAYTYINGISKLTHLVKKLTLQKQTNKNKRYKELTKMVLTKHLFKNEIDLNQDTEDILSSSGLDFEINSAPVEYSIFGKTFRQSSKQVLFLDDGTMLDVVGKNWEVLQPEEIVTPVIESFKDCPLLDDSKASVNASYRRSKTKDVFGNTEKTAKIDININARFVNEEFDRQLRELNILEQYRSYDMDKTLDFSIGVKSSYEYGKGYLVYLVANRKVCSNGLVLPIKVMNSTISHVAKQGASNLIQTALTKTVGSVVTLVDKFSLMNCTPVSKDEQIGLLLAQFARSEETRSECLKLLEQEQAKQIARLYLDDRQINDESRSFKNVLEILEKGIIGKDECQGTVYEAYNALTEYLNHKGESSNKATHLNSMISGGKANDIRLFTDLCTNYARQKQNNSLNQRVMVSV